MKKKYDIEAFLECWECVVLKLVNAEIRTFKYYRNSWWKWEAASSNNVYNLYFALFKVMMGKHLEKYLLIKQ